MPKITTKDRLGPNANFNLGTRNIVLAVAVDTAVIPTMDAKPQPINAASIKTTSLTPDAKGLKINKTKTINISWCIPTNEPTVIVPMTPAMTPHTGNVKFQ
ncbi:MAG: hypothetical protein VYA17_14320 [Pseudomonadota bacterium]|nr:hypothetical protein [Pseudomonadota bacterium]